MAHESRRTRIGVAGWDYPDWNRIVYPLKPPRGFDRLEWIARWVELVEINNTFYRHADPRVSAGWGERVAAHPRFRFTAKAHRSWTHDPAPDLAREIAAGIAGLKPLREAGKLSAVLLQFPQAFHFDAAARDRLETLRERLNDWPLVVEVRHESWASQLAEDWLRERSLGWCAVDQPAASRTTIGLVPRATAQIGYLRLHGRNVAQWFAPEAGRDARYDYRYSFAELSDLAQTVRRLAEAVAELFVVQNNHFRGQALVNALEFRSLIEGRRPEAPREIVTSYPDLAPHVVVRDDRLF